MDVEEIDLRIEEAERLLKSLMAKRDALVRRDDRRVYDEFDPLCEMDRLSFVLGRDGKDATLAFARGLIKIYLTSSLKGREKFRTRNHVYRFKYVESAYSIRHLIRNDLLGMKK